MANTKTYAELNAELDEILVKLQSGELDIDEAVKLYERGTELLKLLEKYLKEAENQVSKIKTNLE